MVQLVRRGLLLVVQGIIYNNGLFQIPWGEMRYPSVLGRIGLAYLFAGLIFLNAGVRARCSGLLACCSAMWIG